MTRYLIPMGSKTDWFFLVDGIEGGLIIPEIMNWTGHLIAAPHSSRGDLLRRPEVSRAGVYILVSEDEDESGEELAYIGEADDL